MEFLEIKGKYCKDIKVFTDNIEEEALSVLYHISEMKAYDGAKVSPMRIGTGQLRMAVVDASVAVKQKNS